MGKNGDGDKSITINNNEKQKPRYPFLFLIVDLFLNLRPLSRRQSDSNTIKLKRSSKIEDSQVLGRLKYKFL